MVDRYGHRKKDLNVKEKNMSHVWKVAIFGSTIVTVMSLATTASHSKQLNRKALKDVYQQLAHAEQATLDNSLS